MINYHIMYLKGQLKQVTQARELREYINTKSDIITPHRREILPVTYEVRDCGNMGLV